MSVVRKMAAAIANSAPPKRGGSRSTPVQPPSPPIYGKGVVASVNGGLQVYFNGAAVAAPCESIGSGWTPEVGMVLWVSHYDRVLLAHGPVV